MATDGSRHDGLKTERRARDLFLQALDLPDGERERFLAGADHDTVVTARAKTLVDRYVRSLRPAAGASGDSLPREIGPFRVERLLGSGATSRVYLARRGDEPQPVALKVMDPGWGRADLVRRFRREADIVARLDHPHIARLVASGSVDGEDGEQPYLATEFVAGATLREWAGERQPTTGERLAVFADIVAAIAYAQGMGVVHRDLKPENVRVTPDGRAVVLDFGVSRLVGDQDILTSVATRPGQIIGTLRYMSPEQLDCRPAGPAADVFALGVMLQELLTGDVPFTLSDGSLYGAIVALASATPRRLPQSLTSDHPGLEILIANALARDPRARYPTAAAFAADLERVRRRKKVTVLRSPAAVPAGGRRWWLLALVAVAAVLGAYGLGWKHGRAPAVSGPILEEITTAGALAARRMRFEPPTVAGVEEAIGALEHAYAALDPGSGQEAVLAWLLTVRLGDGYLLLGRLREDEAAYRRSLAWYARGAESIPSLEALDGLQHDWPLLQDFRDLGPHRPEAGEAAVHRELARLVGTRPELEAAVAAGTLARSRISSGNGPAWPAWLTDGERRYAAALVDLTLAACLADLGAASADTARFDAALALFAGIETTAVLSHRDRRAHAEFLHEYGRAFLGRHLLDGRPSDLDSALARLGEAWRVSGAPRYGDRYPLIAASRARASVAATRLDTTAGVARLRRSLAEADIVADNVAPSGQPRPRFELLAARVMLRQELAARTGRPGPLLAADSLLAVADTLVSSERYPVLLGRRHVLRARTLRILADQVPDRAEELRGRARVEIDEAARLQPAIRNPAFAAELRREESRLESSRHG